jgi:hypothetical protein
MGQRRAAVERAHGGLIAVGASNEAPALVVLAAGRARRYGGCKPLAPVGPDGEAVIDLLAGDALAAGFGTIVLVIGPATGPAIRYHVGRRWPASADVRFAVQQAPRGTVEAVLTAAQQLGPHPEPFGVANADDLYGEAALRQLAEHQGGPDAGNTLVGFRLRDAVVGTSPVTRGVCDVAPDGMLRGVTERRQVTATRDGLFRSDDGLEPVELDGDALVSMNLWGFGPDMAEVFRTTMAEATHASEDAEVLLPEVVGAQVAKGTGFRVLPAEGRCIGVTHPDDLGLVRAEVAQSVGAGERPARPFATFEPRQARAS